MRYSTTSHNSAQVASLASILLDPFYRTFDGLRLLIQREWVDFGHKFVDRTACEEEAGQERSPIFLQWISALHEVTEHCSSGSDCRLHQRREAVRERLSITQHSA